MTALIITQINLRPVQEFTGDRMKQAQRMNADVRTGIAQGIHQIQVLTHRTVLASIGMGGLACDNAWQRLTDGWELLDKAEQRGEEIEHNMLERVNNRVHHLEAQAEGELRKLRMQLPSVPAIPSVPALPTVPAIPGSQIVSKQLDKPLDWTVRRFTIRRPTNGADCSVLAGYDDLTARYIIDMLGRLDASTLEEMRISEANGKVRITVLRAIDAELDKKLAIV